MTQHRIKLVITDLDNTLYDWVTFFAQSFRDMAAELGPILDLPADAILDEFKSVHQRHGNSEHPFAVLELPTVQERFRGATREELLVLLAGPLKAFNSTRKKTLRLYDGVRETLAELQCRNIGLVAHTEAVPANSYYRLERLDIASFFSHLYSLEPITWAPLNFSFPHPDYLQLVPRSERKPNPRLLRDICGRESVQVDRALYIGDSIARDILMAAEAGVHSVWAKYGNVYEKSLWGQLVRITHWTDDDVRREEDLRARAAEVTLEFIAEGFADLLAIIERLDA